MIKGVLRGLKGFFLKRGVIADLRGYTVSLYVIG